MATLTVQNLPAAGLAPTFAAVAGGGDDFVNDGTPNVIWRNTSGAPITVTAVTPRTIDGLAVADRTFSVPAAAGGVPGELIAPPFETSVYNNADDKAAFTYSTPTGLSVAVIEMGG